MVDKLTVHLWDEIGGEWGPTYIDLTQEDPSNVAVHRAAMRSIDYEGYEGDQLRYRLQTRDLSVNIGYTSDEDRNVLFVDLWGPDAEKVVAGMKEREANFDDYRSPRTILNAIATVQAVIHGWR